VATSVSRTLLAASLLFSTSFANAGETPPPAYQLIALPAGVPSEVLYSIALQESGTRLRGRLVPWPWTLNVAGNGYRFANRSDACGALLHALRTAGSHRVDVGWAQTAIATTRPVKGWTRTKTLRSRRGSWRSTNPKVATGSLRLAATTARPGASPQPVIAEHLPNISTVSSAQPQW